MIRKRLLLYLIFAVYQFAAFIFTIKIDGLDLFQLGSIARYIPIFPYLSGFGVILILIDFIWYWMDHRTSERKNTELEKENNILKAKIYDYQEAAKKTDPVKPV